MGDQGDLLFGLLSVQMGYATAEQILMAVKGSDRVPGGLGRFLEEAGVIGPGSRLMLEDLCEKLLEAGGAEVHQTLQEFGDEALRLQSFGGSLGFGGEDAPTLRDAPTKVEACLAVTPETIGRYRLKAVEGGQSGAELGRGGIGRVLLAQDRHLGRDVALKELLMDERGEGAAPSAAASTALVRFLREARVTGQLEHPGIVPVYELGQRYDGRMYYTMKIVRGRTLGEAMEEAENLDERLALLPHFMAVCQAVAYAHSRGVVHRDLKPDNVMLGSFGETVVLDWGLAKVLGQEDTAVGELDRGLNTLKDLDSAETVQGTTLGTPRYMSPEQADGLVDRIDERSDVWSLGVMLYELLAGRPAYDGDDAYEVISRIMDEDEAPPPLDDAPPDLRAVVDKAMAREQEQRYAHAGELAEELDEYLAGRRVRAYDYGGMDLLKRFVRQRRALLSVAIAALLALVVLAATAYVRVWEERGFALEEKERAEVQLAQALADKAEGAQDSTEALHFAAASLALNKTPRARGLLLQHWLHPQHRWLWSSSVCSGKGLFDPLGLMADQLGYGPRRECTPLPMLQAEGEELLEDLRSETGMVIEGLNRIPDPALEKCGAEGGESPQP